MTSGNTSEALPQDSDSASGNTGPLNDDTPAVGLAPLEYAAALAGYQRALRTRRSRHRPGPNTSHGCAAT